jgi:hypothetical protein
LSQTISSGYKPAEKQRKYQGSRLKRQTAPGANIVPVVTVKQGAFPCGIIALICPQNSQNMQK